MRWAKCEEIKSGSKVRARGIECCGTDVLEVQYDGRYEEFFVPPAGKVFISSTDRRL